MKDWNNEVEKKLTHLIELLEHPVSALQAETKEKVRGQFSIMFFSNRSDAIKSFRSGEFRSTRPLELGKDVQLIATDTLEHVEEVKLYLDSQSIKDVTVETFNNVGRFSLHR